MKAFDVAFWIAALAGLHMSKLYHFAIVAFIAVTFVGCKSDNASIITSRQAQKEAIEAVGIQFQSAMMKCSNSMEALKKNPIRAALSHESGAILQKYQDDLVAIDISHCPEDFRIAFVKYYQAVGSSKIYADSITGWNGFFKGLTQGPKAMFSLHDNNDKAVDPLVKAGNDLLLVLTKYNVDIK